VLPENYPSAFYRAQLADWPGLQLVACAPTDGQVVGYCLGKMEAARVGHITAIAVLPAHRNGGAATAIMREVTARMRQSYGASRVSLNVRLSNLAALHVYTAKLGYATEAVYARYYADGEDALHLVLALSDEEHGEARRAARGEVPGDGDERPDAGAGEPARNKWF
jgi:peptide alpha-N-acetyltransferase